MAAERIARSEQVVARTIGGERLLIPIKGNSADLRKIFALNATAAAVWDLLARESTFDELLERLAATYEAESGTMRSDLEVLLASLQARGLIVRGASGG